LPTGFSLTTGETATKTLGTGTITAGSSASVSWQVVAGDTIGSYQISVSAEGRISGNVAAHGTYLAYSYSDRIGGSGKGSTSVVSPKKYGYVYCTWGMWTMQDEMSYLHSLDPSKYSFDWYNEGNIENLWANLGNYKALLIDEDTFYSDWWWSKYGGPIYDSFRTHASDLEAFVKNGGGIFTSGENNLYRTQTWDWLPPGMQVTSYDPERISNVYIVFDPGAPKGLYSYPNTITNSYLSQGHTHAWFTSWDAGYTVTVRRTDNDMAIELYGVFGKGCIVVSHVEAEGGWIPTAWEYLQNQLDFVVPAAKYTMTVLSPATGTVYKVGDIVLFKVIIADAFGNPGTGAAVTVNSPTGALIPLMETPPGSGIYIGTYTILPTDPIGTWTISFVASIEGEFPKETIPVIIPADAIPPSTTLSIGSPQYIDPVGNLYVTSNTPFILTATDNLGGTGVNKTAYRIYNTSYDTGWLEYVMPFHLTGLADGAYNIDYNSTDNAGNVEPTNTATIVLDNVGPLVTIVNPPSGWALQDGVTFIASAIDSGSGVASLNFSIRETNGAGGIPVGFENLPATYNATTDKWTLFFDTLLLPDGYYVVLARAKDNLGNIGPITIVPYSIRNWAIIELLPASESNKAGRTMPVKFALRVAAAVDPLQPFVYNEELVIRICATNNPSVILQESRFGDTARDYRINTISEHYITNFKTLSTPMEYTVTVSRDNFDLGSFTFKTVK
jgi:hypothetical protein